jgi:hypothetical protein
MGDVAEAPESCEEIGVSWPIKPGSDAAVTSQGIREQTVQFHQSCMKAIA